MENVHIFYEKNLQEFPIFSAQVKLNVFVNGVVSKIIFF